MRVIIVGALAGILTEIIKLSSPVDKINKKWLG
jgi:hypothetical protein